MILRYTANLAQDGRPNVKIAYQPMAICAMVKSRVFLGMGKIPP